MYSLVISTIGCPFLLDSLASLSHPPDDIIVVVDVIGRRASTLESEYPLARLRQELAERWPALRVLLYDPPPQTWAVHNGCYNVGWKAARRPYVWFTHDDVTYPAFNYPRALNPVLRAIAAAGGVIDGRTVAGVVVPEYETVNGVTVPDYPDGSRGLTQCISPVSQIVSVAAMRKLGGFDEAGIWYDGHLQAETFVRDWWYLLLPTPKVRHESNRTYRVNNWGNHWGANPVWGTYQDNFHRRYGHVWERYMASDEPIEPLRDERFATLVAC